MSNKDMFMSNNRRDQLLNEQRKRLQQCTSKIIKVRLQTESENTKLLKIQQKERQVESQYQKQKRNMEQTLDKLSVEAQKFTSKQILTIQQFQSQKEQILANDRKKQSYLKQKQDLEVRNRKRRQEIQEKQQTLQRKKLELEEIRGNIKKYEIFEQFLEQVRGLSDDFSSSQMDEYGVMSILDRFFTMENKKAELVEVHRKIENEKQVRSKRTQRLKKEKQEKILYFNSKIKDLKEKIDVLNEENLHLESQLEGKLNEVGQRQREIGQVIFSIRGLYQSIAGEEKQQIRNTIQMLRVIREERKKLKEYLELFTQKTHQKRLT